MIYKFILTINTFNISIIACIYNLLFGNIIFRVYNSINL